MFLLVIQLKIQTRQVEIKRICGNRYALKDLNIKTLQVGIIKSCLFHIFKYLKLHLTRQQVKHQRNIHILLRIEKNEQQYTHARLEFKNSDFVTHLNI